MAATLLVSPGSRVRFRTSVISKFVWNTGNLYILFSFLFFLFLFWKRVCSFDEVLKGILGQKHSEPQFQCFSPLLAVRFLQAVLTGPEFKVL